MNTNLQTKRYWSGGTSAILMLAVVCSSPVKARTIPAFSGTPSAGVGENVAQSGYPGFWDRGESIRLTTDGEGPSMTFTLSGFGRAASFNLAPGTGRGNAFAIGNERVSWTASFNASDLSFISGQYQITGTLTSNSNSALGQGINWNAVTDRSTILFSADLTGYGFDPEHRAIGFNTANLDGWATQPGHDFTGGSIGESLWLFASSGRQWQRLSDIFAGNGKSGKVYSLNLSSYATVPVPPSIWLIGSAIAGLVSTGRWRSEKPRS